MTQRYFNINDDVWIKLTEHGRRILGQQHDELYDRCRKDSIPPYQPPKEDEEGWSKWTMWELMNQLGDYCYNGGEVPFETEIKFDETDLKVKK